MEDVFLFENGDIPASYVSLPEGNPLSQWPSFEFLWTTYLVGKMYQVLPSDLLITQMEVT